MPPRITEMIKANKGLSFPKFQNKINKSLYLGKLCDMLNKKAPRISTNSKPLCFIDALK